MMRVQLEGSASSNPEVSLSDFICALDSEFVGCFDADCEFLSEIKLVELRNHSESEYRYSSK